MRNGIPNLGWNLLDAYYSKNHLADKEHNNCEKKSSRYVSICLYITTTFRKGRVGRVGYKFNKSMGNPARLGIMMPEHTSKA